MKKRNQNTPFRVPKSYFETLEKELELKVQQNTKDHSAWITPKDYFNSLEDKLQTNTPTKKARQYAPVVELVFSAAIIGLISLFSLNSFNWIGNSEEDILAEYGDELFQHQHNALYYSLLIPDEDLLAYDQLILEDLGSINPDYYPEFSNPLNYDEIDQ